MRTVFPDRCEQELKGDFFGAQRAGYFVEVGANDPYRGSQTWTLEQLGWDGVLVEPQPDLAEQLRRSRSARVVAAACSAPENNRSVMTLYLCGPHSSLSRSLAAAGARANSTVEVPVRTLNDVLAEAEAPAPIDFVSIDVEGHELEVLRGFDAAYWRPRLILVEDHLASLSAHRHLTRAGYRLIRRTGLNGWYVPDAAAPPLGWGVLQLARKYYLSQPFRLLRNWKRRLFGQLQNSAMPAAARSGRPHDAPPARLTCRV